MSPAGDAILVAQLVQASREPGIEVHPNKAVTAIERRDDHLLVHARTGEQEQVVEADLVVHAAGRVPEIDDLNLEAAGVAREAVAPLHHVLMCTTIFGDGIARSV